MTDAIPPSWINKGRNDIAAWIKPKMVGRRDPNGTFVIHSRVGDAKVQSRVLVGHIVIDRDSVLYTCHPSEARDLLAELEAKDTGAYAALPKNAGHPGSKLAEADVAPRGDDTDDITRRIRAVDLRSPESPRKSAAEPQKSAVSRVDLHAKKIGRLAPPEIAQSTARKPQKSAISPPPDKRMSTTPKRWPAAKGNPPSVENRSPSELHLDDSYQRSTDNGASQALIRRIANGWDWRMCLPLVVSKRDDGTLWVIDGQHRLAAAILRGDIPFLPCCVGVYGSVADEAAMFVAMNRARKPMNRLDDFHAALAGGDPEAAEVKQLIVGAGFTVSRKTGSQSWMPGEVAFTSAIAKVLRKHGEQVCAAALKTIADAFPGQVLNAGASMFTALTKLTLNPPETYDPERMFRTLRTRTQKEWAGFLSHHKGGGDDRAMQLREVLLMAYEEVPEVADA
jgi:hypothetical protein